MASSQHLIHIFSTVLTLFTPAFAANTSGCGKTLPSNVVGGGTGQSTTHTLVSNGVTRTYLLHVPTSLDNTVSHGLIFSFHGHSHTAVYQENLTQFSDPSVNPHYVVAYPQGKNNEWQGFPGATTNDVQFTLDMISVISRTICIDTTRIYASGKSNGASFSVDILAGDPTASKQIAAFAGASAANFQFGQTQSSCKPNTVPIAISPGRKSIPILEIHGSADNIIPYAGGWANGGGTISDCLPSVPHFMTNWATTDGLSSSYQQSTLANGQVTYYRWGQSTNQLGLVQHYDVSGMGHVWPSTKGNAEAGPQPIDASSIILAFFDQYTLST
jgi:poly(3-hydroxybutyrate) depolymerase